AELFSSSSNGANHPTGSKISLTAVDQRFPNVLKSRPDHMRDVLHSAYRLTPDNRLLLAVGEVHSFFSGEAPEKAAATWAGQHWLIEYKDRKIGTLPELPDFPDFIQLLSQWAQQLETQYPLNLTSRPGVEWEQGLTKKLDRVLVPNVVSALKEMDALWRQGQHDSKLLQLGARGLALITLQATDRMEIMDPLPAKALAMLSIARGLTPHNLNREECLLAEAMDYAAHAVRLSRKLIPSDPLRHFVNRNDRLLQALAKSKKAGRLADYLWLLRLSRRENMQDWHLWLKTAFGDDPISLPLLKSGLDYKSFFTSRNFTREVRHIVLLELDREEKGPAAKPSRDQAVNTFLAHNTYYQVLNALLDLGNPTIVDTMEHMESGLEVLEKKYQGPFLKANTYKSYFNAYFYSTLYIEGLYY
ncbi:MAG: hypothetical protein GWM98_02810, partial [Nitrospinaceae bacterium]|nr:hypothetical protein [Nitrospinaceae bacterium]NIR53629.1 hypothetical protein [Nitrospinaceae bacterium]NIS84032.1 hypothetical protein [Nitrospinaceae bacterium]NIT80836.1 hypothetical protein [Nitrospinaceae bacterium]NIU43145.1 hypothetical protein [Nitrospinaceae bacterium]